MLTIIGCGNPNRSDDGAGVSVARRLMAHASPDVRVFDAGTAGMEVMFQARGSDALVIVDASDSGSEPGSIFRVPGEALAQAPEPSYSLHGFRWDHALHAGKKIFREDFPHDVTVYLIERETLELGVGLSPRVAAAVDRVARLLLERLKPRASIRIARGSFYLSAELYERYFHGLQSVAVLSRGERFALVPLVAGGSGGHLVKVRNARGDRVIHAREFLEEQRVSESDEHELSVSWDSELAALTMPNPQRANAHGC
jgi:hydrogenase maturation protease